MTADAVELRRPETKGQAQRWDAIKRHAHTLGGLCYPCAVAFAYGTQLGYAQVNPPCPACAAVVASWPVCQLNGWRSLNASHDARASWEGLAPDQIHSPPGPSPLSVVPGVPRRGAILSVARESEALGAAAA